MQPDVSLSWIALGLTPGLASCLSARVLRRFDSPEGAFRASLPDLESCHLPAQVAQAIAKKESFKRREGIGGHSEDCGLHALELDGTRIPAVAFTNLQPACPAIRSRRSAGLESSQPQHRRHAPAYPLWHANGPASRP